MTANESKIEIQTLGKEHLRQISRIHAAAFPDGIWTKLGDTVVRRFYLWHLEGPHEAAEMIGAFTGGNCAGFILTGVFNGSTTGFIKKNRGLLMQKIILRPHLAFDEVFRERFGRGFKLFRRTFQKTPLKKAAGEKQKSYGFLSMGVLPEFRNLGIGTALMRKAEERAAERGYGTAHFTVNPANAGAIRIYEKLGWQKSLDNGDWKGIMKKNISVLRDE